MNLSIHFVFNVKSYTIKAKYDDNDEFLLGEMGDDVNHYRLL